MAHSKTLWIVDGPKRQDLKVNLHRALAKLVLVYANMDRSRIHHKNLYYSIAAAVLHRINPSCPVFLRNFFLPASAKHHSKTDNTKHCHFLHSSPIPSVSQQILRSANRTHHLQSL